MIAEQYACSSSQFHILYGLRKTHFQGMLVFGAATRHATKLRPDVLGVEKRIIDGLMIMEVWAISIIAESGLRMGSPETIFSSI